MAKKKKKSGLAFWAPKKKKKKTKAQIRADKEATFLRIRIFSAIFAVVLIAAAVCVGFFYLEKYVKRVSPVAHPTGPLVFPHDNVPQWFNEELAGLMRETAGKSEFILNDDSAKIVGVRLKTLKWIDLEYLKVQTTKDSLRVTAKYHKPIASIKLGGSKYCLAINETDNKLIAMPYLNISKLPIVEITESTLDNVEDVAVQGDIDAAVMIIKALSMMDKVRKDAYDELVRKIKSGEIERVVDAHGKEIKPTPVAPLLNDIASINVSNFRGLKYKSKSKSHLVLFTEDEIPINWGSAIGETTGNFEATDEDKLSKLYDFFTRDGKNTLLNRNVKYIDLRNP